MFRVGALTAIAMFAFAANSVLARLALGTGDLDASGYTGIRLISGAIMLGMLLYWRRDTKGSVPFRVSGSWAGAAALFGYAICFSIAYLLLGAGTGALILFASVQFGMLGWAVLKGDRPSLLEWVGIALAFAALAYLVSPGLWAPDPFGAALMVLAGLSWAGYTLIGRGSSAALADTAGNFIRCAPVALLLIGVGLATRLPSPVAVFYAIASGAVASGLGYAIWYAAVPNLTRTRAAIVQLTVPVIAAAGGVMFIAEPLTQRLLVASAGVIGGVGLALLAAEWRKSTAARQRLPG